MITKRATRIGGRQRASGHPLPLLVFSIAAFSLFQHISPVAQAASPSSGRLVNYFPEANNASTAQHELAVIQQSGQQQQPPIIPLEGKYVKLGNNNANSRATMQLGGARFASNNAAIPAKWHHYYNSRLALNQPLPPPPPAHFHTNQNHHQHSHHQQASTINGANLAPNSAISDLSGPISSRFGAQTIGDTNTNNQQPQQQQQQKRVGLLDKVCIGTSNRMSGQHNKSDHYQNLAERYRNCTYVIGNLEITWLDRAAGGGGANERPLDLSFLESIREITGYLLIAYVDVDRIRMPNLQIIRGRDLFKLNNEQKEEFAMILIENELKSLELPNLREILAGSVGSYNNRNLCHIRTINWDEILNWPMYRSLFVYNGTEPECAPCDGACLGSCWAEGAEMCQKVSKTNCSPQCNQGRCFGPSAAECCHSYCAGGCTGPKQTDCLACKNFYDDGECIQECPSMMRYNPSKFLWEANPNGKYAFGATCVKECPEHLLRDNGACVRTCPPNKRSVNGECVPCGGPCPKNCQGVEVVHSGNIDQLINCTVIEGSITIQDSSFTGHIDLTNPASGSASSSASSSSPSSASSSSSAGSSSSSSSSASPHAASSSSSSINVTSSTISLQQLSPNSSPANGNSSLVKSKPMHPSRLEVFKTLREITGSLIIQANHSDFKNLSCFRNLKTIGGRQTMDMLYALSITKSSLVSLNLRSLRKVRSGKILIEDNKDLCFAATIDWLQINITRREDISERYNADPAKCRALNLQCHEQCAQDGCWGPGPDECLSCNNYKLDDFCVDNCTSIHSSIAVASGGDASTSAGSAGTTAASAQLTSQLLAYDSGGRTCKRCHPECKGGCNGVEARHCWQCKNVKDGPYCVNECPSHKYNNNGTCEECDKSCLDGCTGPANKLGEGGCNSCGKAIITSSEPPPAFAAHCIKAEEPCPEGYYQEYFGPQAEGPLARASPGKPVCRKCHNRCKSCTGMGTHVSVCECAKYVADEQCEDFCPRDSFPDEQLRQCVKCSAECNGCFGPTEADCVTCRVYRIYYDSSYSTTTSGASPMASAQVVSLGGSKQSGGSTFVDSSNKQQVKFNCTAQCPPDKPHRISESNMLDPYCSEEPGIDPENPRIAALGSTSILFILIISASLMVCVSVYRCQIEKDKTVKLTLHLSGIDDVEPLNPSNMKPNLAPLRSIKETELRKGNVLGSGFGGTVYQGFWYPEGQEHTEPRPVAIKVLRDNGQSNKNKEFLDEAYIMASVNHQNLVRLLAVCMTPNHLMLVTPLMPLGCLLEYVKKHKTEIGSKNLLEWGKQIARGMAYLEEHRMVHRDLALRNVLLQTSGRALISDFGLAKFLELDQSEYHSGGGRLPIKWLAPECIRERKFTHKSDVWAFGVTLWELLTFGMRPFEEYDTKDVPMAIEKGARLQQPNYVTAEVYMAMYSCWFYSPEDRPNFKELAQKFSSFAGDPKRFLTWSTKEIVYNTNTTSRSSSKQKLAAHELRRNSESDDCEYHSDASGGFSGEEESQPPLSAMPDLTPSTHNQLNEMFGFEQTTRHHHHHHQLNHGADQSVGAPTPASHLSTPTFKKSMAMFHGSSGRDLTDAPGANVVADANGSVVFHHHQQQVAASSQSAHVDGQAATSKLLGHSSTSTIMMTDANNNNTFAIQNSVGRMNAASTVDSCWSMHHTVSTNSLGQKSEQPTDVYDYLLPSPCTDDSRAAGHFSSFYAGTFGEPKSTPISPTTPSVAAKAHLRQPPLSAGLIGVNNEEYFLTRVNYVNQQQQQLESHNLEQQQQLQQQQMLSTSNGNIPHSLV